MWTDRADIPGKKTSVDEDMRTWKCRALKITSTAMLQSCICLKWTVGKECRF